MGSLTLLGAYDEAVRRWSVDRAIVGVNLDNSRLEALGFIESWEEQLNNLYEVVGKRRAQRLAFSMRQTKEWVCANVYNRAFNSSYVGGDGVEFVDLQDALDLCEESLQEAEVAAGDAGDSGALPSAGGLV